MKTKTDLRRSIEHGALTTTPPGDSLAPAFQMCLSRGKQLSRNWQREAWAVIRKKRGTGEVMETHCEELQELSVGNT